MQCDRRSFLGGLGAVVATGPANHSAADAQTAAAPDRSSAWRREFPALDQRVHGHRLAYLDSAATTLRPRAVIDAVSRFYETDNANPGAALHTLARRSASRYAAARARVATFLNADPSEVVFTKGTTEGLNLVATVFAAELKPGDEIVLTVAEHYSNLLPWRALATRTGAIVRVVDIDDHGRLMAARFAAAITSRTRLIAFGHVSNVLGLVAPAAEILCRGPGPRGAGRHRRGAVGAPSQARRPGPRLRLPRLLIAQDARPDGGRRAVGAGKLARSPAAVSGGQQHGPRGGGRQRPVRARRAEVPGRHAQCVRAGWAGRGARHAGRHRHRPGARARRRAGGPCARRLRARPGPAGTRHARRRPPAAGVHVLAAGRDRRRPRAGARRRRRGGPRRRHGGAAAPQSAWAFARRCARRATSTPASTTSTGSSTGCSARPVAPSRRNSSFAADLGPPARAEHRGRTGRVRPPRLSARLLPGRRSDCSGPPANGAEGNGGRSALSSAGRLPVALRAATPFLSASSGVDAWCAQRCASTRLVTAWSQAALALPAVAAGKATPRRGSCRHARWHISRRSPWLIRLVASSNVRRESPLPQRPVAVCGSPGRS